MTKEYGTSSRTFKSGAHLVRARIANWFGGRAAEAARLESIDEEDSGSSLDDAQKRLLAENLKKSLRDLKRSVWRTYKNPCAARTTRLA